MSGVKKVALFLAAVSLTSVLSGCVSEPRYDYNCAVCDRGRNSSDDIVDVGDDIVCWECLDQCERCEKCDNYCLPDELSEMDLIIRGEEEDEYRTIDVCPDCYHDDGYYEMYSYTP